MIYLFIDVPFIILQGIVSLKVSIYYDFCLHFIFGKMMIGGEFFEVSLCTLFNENLL